MKNRNPANVSTEIHHPLNTNQVLLNHYCSGNGVFKVVKIVVPLKYLSNFWIS